MYNQIGIMKKSVPVAIILLGIILFSFCAGVFSCVNTDCVAFASTPDTSTTISTEAPKSLGELQTASDSQLDAWTKLSKFDGREYDYITPERNQGGKLICWAYTAIGAVEASILRKGIDPSVTKNTLNLDEIVAAYVRHNRDGTNDPLFNTSNDTFSDEWNQGAHADDAFLSMTQGYSPVEQTTSDSSSDDAIKKAVSESKYFVRGYTRIGNDIDVIKRAVLQYGSVAMEYKAPNSTQQTYLYHSDGSSLGHASLIVGWDDSVKSNLFWPDHPTSDGAWIVKNSWGAGGNYLNGTYCFYLSYDSYLSDNLYCVDTSLKRDYPNLYYYDGQIADNGINYITDAHGAIYEAKLSSATERERLKAVVIGVRNKKLTADIKVYRHLQPNPGNVNDKINDPSDGELAAEKRNVYFENEGLYTVDLDVPVELDQGEYFSIVVSGKDANGNPLFPLYGADGHESVNDMTYRQYNGVWTSLKDSGYYADSSYSNMSARIRAVTDTVPRAVPLGNDLQYARVEISNRLLYYVKGQEQIPDLTVYFGGKTLQKDVDYTVTLLNNVTPGTATVIITGKNDYFGTRTTTFEVAKPKYPPGALSGTVNVYKNITRLHQIPIPEDWVWIDNDLVLKTGLSDFSYSLRYVGEDKDCYQIGTCGFHVNKIDDEPPEKTDISDAVVTISGEYKYTGKQIIPTVKVTYNGLQLNVGVDYTLSYIDNTYAGQATVVVTGVNQYCGEVRRAFEIKRADWPKRPDETLTVGRKVRTLNDVLLYCEGWSWQDPQMEVGERTVATAVYNGQDKDNYDNVEMQITVVKETQRDISTVTATLRQNVFVYDGSFLTPEVTVLDGNVTLEKNADFQVGYQNNRDAGEAAVIITGINDYFGTKTLYFTIEKAARRDFAVTQRDWIFGGVAPEPIVTGAEEDAALTYLYSDDENGTFTANKPTKAGVYWITAQIESSQNYEFAASKSKFTILPKDLSGFLPTVNAYGAVYTGQEVRPKVTLTDGLSELAENKDFSVEYRDNVNAGTNAIVIIRGINNYTGSVSTRFEIKKATAASINTVINRHTFEKLSDVALPDGFQWDESSLRIVSDKVIRAKARYIGSNYDIDELEFEIILDVPVKRGEQSADNAAVTWAIVATVSVAAVTAAAVTFVCLRRKRRKR